MHEVKQCTFINHKHDAHDWFEPIVMGTEMIGKNTFHCEGKS